MIFQIELHGAVQVHSRDTTHASGTGNRSVIQSLEILSSFNRSKTANVIAPFYGAEVIVVFIGGGPIGGVRVSDQAANIISSFNLTHAGSRRRRRDRVRAVPTVIEIASATRRLRVRLANDTAHAIFRSIDGAGVIEVTGTVKVVTGVAYAAYRNSDNTAHVSFSVYGAGIFEVDRNIRISRDHSVRIADDTAGIVAAGNGTFIRIILPVR